MKCFPSGYKPAGIARAALTLASISCLGACSTLPERDQYERLNPPNLNYNDGGISSRANGAVGYINTQRQVFEQMTYEDYYAALSCVLGRARPDASKSAFTCPGEFGTSADANIKRQRIQAYLVQGVNTVKTNCHRWFNAMAVAQQRQAFDSSNESVLKALGHTLLGIGHANPIAVTTAGALDTAYTGFTGNYSQAFLAAPNAKNVEMHVMQVLNDAARTALTSFATSTAPNPLTPGASGPSIREPADAVVWVEGEFAGYCSQKAARDITDTALQNTRSTPGENGSISTQATVQAQNNATSDLSDQVEKLGKSLKEALPAVSANREQITNLQTALKQANESAQGANDANTANQRKIDSLQRALDAANLSIQKLQSVPRPEPSEKPASAP